MILLILEENELLDHVKQVLPELEEEDAKAQIHTKIHIRPIAIHKYIHLRSLVFVCKFSQGAHKVDRKIDLIDTQQKDRPIARHKYIHLRSLVFICKFTHGASKEDTQSIQTLTLRPDASNESRIPLFITITIGFW
jgi:hypothetical protein